MDHAIRRVLAVREGEIQDPHRINILQAIVPLALGSLLTDWISGIVDAAVLEILLLRFLHLHDDAATVRQLTIDIKHSLAVSEALAQMLVVQVGEARNLKLVLKQGVKETDQQILVQLRAEQFLESEVCVRINVPFADFHFHCLFSFFFFQMIFHSS